MQINWKVRFKNPQFWIQIGISIITPVFAYFGLSGSDMTSWPKVWETVSHAAGNPYVLTLIAVSLINAINDPTTAGPGDSVQALTYEQPKH